MWSSKCWKLDRGDNGVIKRRTCSSRWPDDRFIQVFRQESNAKEEHVLSFVVVTWGIWILLQCLLISTNDKCWMLFLTLSTIKAIPLSYTTTIRTMIFIHVIRVRLTQILFWAASHFLAVQKDQGKKHKYGSRGGAMNLPRRFRGSRSIQFIPWSSSIINHNSASKKKM